MKKSLFLSLLLAISFFPPTYCMLKQKEKASRLDKIEGVAKMAAPVIAPMVADAAFKKIYGEQALEDVNRWEEEHPVQNFILSTVIKSGMSKLFNLLFICLTR